jgi:hypothetical protein
MKPAQTCVCPSFQHHTLPVVRFQRLFDHGGERPDADGGHYRGTPANSDLISMTSSTLYLNGQDFSDFAFTSLTGFGVGTYTLIEAGTVSGSLSSSNLSGLIGDDYRGTLSVVGGDLVLTTTLVPEPGTLALLLAASIGLLACGWRKASRLVK